MALDIISLCLSKVYAKKLSSGIAGSTYDPTTSTMTVNLNDGSSYGIVFDDGISVQDREVLDNISYNETDGILEINGIPVLTEDDEADEDIDFGNMFN